MNNKNFYFFDLDGTMIDSKKGIIHALLFALEGYDISVENPEEELTRFIGPPLRDSFQKYYHFSRMQADLAVERYREYYQEKGMLENDVYPGIPALLAGLKQQGQTLLVATSKPTVFSEEILKAHQLDQYFSFVSGATLNGVRDSKKEVLAHAIASCGLKEPQRAAMIGDRMFDIRAAKELGLCSVGVSYGYGSREELTQAGADAIADSVAELSLIVCKKNG